MLLTFVPALTGLDGILDAGEVTVPVTFGTTAFAANWPVQVSAGQASVAFGTPVVGTSASGVTTGFFMFFN